MEIQQTNMSNKRTLNAIMIEILGIWERDEKKWRTKFYGAVAFVDAMLSLDTVDQMYGCDNGRYVVSYFLSNLTLWKGEDARRIKAELKDLLKK